MTNFLFFTSLINDTLNYALNPNNRGEIVFQMVLGLFFLIIPIVAIVLFWRPVRWGILEVWKWIDMHRLNPTLDMEISISGTIPQLAPQDFVLRMREILGNISSSNIIHDSDNSFSFSKNFTSFNIDVIISPSLSSNTQKYDCIFIRLKTKNIKLKKLKEGLSEIQMYLFRDIVGTINRILRFRVDSNNEGISFTLNDTPKILHSIDGINTDNVTASDEDIRVVFSRDNISFNGSVEPRTIEKIEKIIRSNLAS